jgi:hypothetical protein
MVRLGRAETQKNGVSNQREDQSSAGRQIRPAIERETSDEEGATAMLLTQSLWSEFAERVANVIFDKIHEEGIPHKVLLTTAQAAWCLGFTEYAFNQAKWSKEIPIVRIGIKKFYRVSDLEVFAANHLDSRAP